MHLRATLRNSVRAAMPLVILFTAAAVAQACPGCKDALAANDPDHQNIVRGYFWSILFMMGTPYLMLCGFGGYMYLLVRRARAAKQSAEEASATNETEIVAEQFDEIEETVEV
jgi:heme/copper-type cytochrome/quinol oxidase subunit 2